MASVDDLVERIEELEARVADLTEARARWTATVNELNNLVAAMKGHAQLAEPQATDDPTRDLVRVILTSTTRIQELVRSTVQHVAPPAGDAGGGAAVVDPSAFSVLVVDDEPLVRSLLEELLVKAGYRVTSVDSGEAAVQAAGDALFDLVLMDYRLGDMEGTEALRRIREFQAESRVVFLTGDPDTEQVQASVYQAGADGFVTKPFDIQEITEVARHLLLRKGA